MILSLLDDRYELGREIGSGTFGAVYQGTQRSTGQTVAVKVLRAGESASLARRQARLRSEMAACARLHHPNIVRLIDSGGADGELFVVFEWVPGETLASLLAREERLSFADAQHLMGQVLDALVCAHAAGVVHRDIKPQNIMVTSTGIRRQAMVLDFGIASLLETRGAAEIAGSPAYAAPEQLRGEAATPASDLYGWALTFAECMSGERVVAGRSVEAIWYEQLRPERVALPLDVEGHPVASLLRGALERDVDRRRSGAAELLAELEALQPNIETRRAAPPPTAEYRQITVVCVRFALGDPSMSLEHREALVQGQRTRAEAAAQRLGGHQLAVFGDRLALGFGYPVVAEAAVALGLRAGLQICSDIEHVAVGVHTGVIIARSQTAGDVMTSTGFATEPASQLANLAAPGEVLCSDATWLIAQTDFAVERSPRGNRVRRWLGRAALERRDVNSPFVGRRPELDRLMGSLEAAREGAGSAVLLLGEAGVGKSRLIAELEARDRDPRRAWLGARGTPETRDVPFSALAGLLYTMLRTPTDAPMSELRDALRAFLERYPLGGPGHGLALSELLEEPQSSIRIGAAVQAALTSMARDRPLTIVIDDVQWCDRTSLDVLAGVLEIIPSLPALVLLAGRPSFEPPWACHLVYALTLNRIPSEDARTIVTWVAKDGLQSEEIVTEILQRADGIPLFVEQLTRMAIEGGGSGAQSVVPPILRDALSARLAPMGVARDIVLKASILGRSFPAWLLERLCDAGPSDLDEPLLRLAQARILETERRRDGLHYIFQHALLRDAAHASLLETDRRALHRRAAELLQQACPELERIEPSRFADHWAEAGDGGRAVPYFLAAAERAVASSANVEAIAHIRRARALLLEQDDNAASLTLLGLLIPAVLATEGYAAPEVPALVQEALRRANDDPDRLQTLRAVRASCLFHHARGELAVAFELADQCMAVAQRLGLAGERASIRLLLAQCSFIEGRFDDAETRIAEILADRDALADGAQAIVHGQDAISGALVLHAMIVGLRSDTTRALELAEEALDRAHTLGHHNSTAGVLAYVGGLHHFLRNRSGVRRTVEQLLAMSERHALPQWRAIGALLGGWSERQVEPACHVLDGLRAMGVRLAWPYWSSTVAESESHAGHATAAVLRLQAAMQVARDTGEVYYLPELLRLWARTKVAEGAEGASVVDALEEAIERAEQMGARLFAVRSAKMLEQVAPKRGGAAMTRLSESLPAGLKRAELRANEIGVEHEERGELWGI